MSQKIGHTAYIPPSIDQDRAPVERLVAIFRRSLEGIATEAERTGMAPIWADIRIDTDVEHNEERTLAGQSMIERLTTLRVRVRAIRPEEA